MRTKKSLLIGSLMAATLVVAALPASAADTKGTLAIVNGIPGQRVDVCLNGREIRSKLPYGKVWLRNVVGTGSKTIKFFRPDPRTCRGTLLSRKSFQLGPGRDLTIVATKKTPNKVVIFDNVGRGEIPPFGAALFAAPFAMRHAADLAADLLYRWWSFEGDIPISPALASSGDEDRMVIPSATFGKGQEWPLASTNLIPGNVIKVMATLPASPDAIASSVTVEIVASHRYEWILVGTNPGNTRVVVLDRRVSEPTP